MGLDWDAIRRDYEARATPRELGLETVKASPSPAPVTQGAEPPPSTGKVSIATDGKTHRGTRRPGSRTPFEVRKEIIEIWSEAKRSGRTVTKRGIARDLGRDPTTVGKIIRDWERTGEI